MAFIGIKISADIARLFRGLELPGEKIPENEYHITILCFEENWSVSDISNSMEAALEVLQDTEPFQVVIDRITCFPKRESKPCPIIAKITSKDLEKVNRKLKKSFDKNSVEYSKVFKTYAPHMTLSYTDEEIEELVLDKPIEFTVTEIVLWGGDHGDDKIFITFPLKGIAQKKSALLLQKINVFDRLNRTG